MCGNGSACTEERRMPASSGDPVSAALHMSLAGNKCTNLKNDDLDNKIIASSRRVLLSDIQYETAGSYTNTVLDSLKSKYIVLNANVCDNKVDIKVKHGPKEPQIKDCINSNSNINNSPKKIKPEVSLPVPKRVLYPPEAIQLGWQTSTPVGSGMVNLRNTCYLNSTLQALFHVPAFVNWILNDKIHSTKCGMINGTGHTECLICAVMKTLQFSQRNSGTPIKPLQIYTKLKRGVKDSRAHTRHVLLYSQGIESIHLVICKHFDHGHQEDAHEFLRYLIESMERSYLTIVQGTKLDSYSKETTPLNQIFGGYLRTEVTCLECRHVSITFQHFQDLLLDIRTVSSVDDALEAYFGREQLGEGEEAYRCEQCHRRVAATKKFSIQKAPNVLCIQLKRFGILGGKISKHVSLKQKLDLVRYMHPSSSTTSELTYRLVSLISHIGPSSSCGHYTAIAASSSGFFYLFDDSMVRQVPLQSVLSTNAYVIVYELEPTSAARPVKPAPAFTVKSTTNGVNGKPIQNGVTQSPLSVHKQALVLSSSKAERTTAVNASSTACSSVPTFPLIASSSQSNTSPKPLKMSNGVSSPSKSLVPYIPNESSDSESENAVGYRSGKQFSLQPNTVKESKAPPTVNGLVKEATQKTQMLFSSCSNKSSTSKDLPSAAMKLKFHQTTSSSPSPKSSTNNVSKNEKFTASLHSNNHNHSLPVKKLPSINEPPTLIMNGWHVSESLSSPNGSAGSSTSTSVGSCVGQWNVTEINKTRSTEKVETITTENISIPATATSLPSSETSMRTVNGNSLCSDNGAISNNISSNNGSSNSSTSSRSSLSNSNGNTDQYEWNGSNVKDETCSKMWDGSRNNGTVNELLKMSHRGYGTSNVNTWNGGKSEVEKEVEKEKQEQRKRSFQNLYDEDMDRGKVKKVKNYAYSSTPKNDMINGRRYNPFQEHQNRKHSWHANGNSKRHLFYRNYNNIDRYRNNHRVYHSQNGYRSWRH